MDTPREQGPLAGTIVVIPALDPEPALSAYAAELLARGALQVLVVDDGSSASSAAVFAALEAQDGCTLLRHPVNRGKGQALKTAFTYILEQPDWTGAAVVTADADGQHHADDVCAVAAALSKEKDRLLLGTRDLTLPHVPPRSKLGNRLTAWGFHLLYGVRLSDTQTGLRGIPYDLLPWCAGVGGDRFEYEMNMLVKAAREHIEMGQVPIQTIYYNNNAGTHLRAVRDSWRVFVILISGLGWYTASAALSAIADVAAFAVSNRWIFQLLSPAACYWWSVLLARALSSTINYTLNRRYVFGTKPRSQVMARYYCLWLCQLMASYLLLLGLSALLPWAPPEVLKVLGDIALAVCSYQIQLHWVFREERA